MILTRDFSSNFQSRQNSYEKAHCNFLKGSTTLLPPLMSANILRLTCNDNVRPNYFFFLQFLRARISSSCFLQSETVFLAMVWGHAMHSLELAAAAPRLEQQSAGYILVSSPGQRLCPGWENVIRPNHHNWLLPAFFVSSSGC